VTGPERPAWVPSDLYPFEDRWAEINGNLLHYVDEGTGPPLLLLNGNPSWSFGWRDVILALRDSFRCIAPDYPGFGLSRAVDGYDFRPASHSKVIETLVDRLGLERMVVFGYAWGGPIGLGLAGRRPEGIRALVIGNTWAWPDDRLKVRLFSALMGGPLSHLLVDRLNLMLRLYLPANLKRKRLTDQERAAYSGPFPPGKRRQMSAFPREIVTGRSYLREVEASLPKLAGKPALIVWPDSDPGLGDAELRRWQALFPAARTVLLPKTGQFIDEDAPEDVAAAIADWWATEAPTHGNASETKATRPRPKRKPPARKAPKEPPTPT
jgi:haloalkane dehalogenase